MKPKVTVGLCVKNCEDFIGEAIESILDQDFPHELTELVIVDGYSKDRTVSFLKESLDKADLKHTIFQENEGLGRARQIVVDNAGGDYIIWVDGDMVLARDFFSKQVEFMDQNPNVGIAKGKHALKPGDNWIGTLEIYSRAVAKMVDFNYEDKAHSKSMGTSGCIYRVSAIRQVGGFDEDIKGYGEDLDAEYRVRRAGWLLSTTSVEYRDYERRGLTWKDVWYRYFQRGYDLCHFSNKNKGMIDLCKMLPPAAFLAGLFHSLDIYKLTTQKLAFALPFQYVFKMTAWCLGFFRSSIDAHMR